MITKNVFALVFLFPLLSLGEWVKIDDFQGYPPDLLPKKTNGWTLARPDVSRVLVAADPADPANQALKVQRLLNVKSDQHDVIYHQGAVNIAPGQTGTVFLRFLAESGLDTTLGSTTGDKPAENLGLKFGVSETDLNAGNCWAGVWVGGKNCTTYGIRSASHTPSLPVRRNTWYRLWLVIEHQQGEGNPSKAYLQEEGKETPVQEIPGIVAGPFGKDRGIFGTIGLVKSRESGLTDIWIDDVYVDNGQKNLTNPVKSQEALGWKERLAVEAAKYRHLTRKASTPAQAEKQARELLSAMTQEERFALVCGDGAVGLPGFPRLGIPPVVFSDASAGINNNNAAVKSRHARTVAYPCLALLAATWDTSLAEAYARSIGEECRSGGTHVLLAPSVNFYRVAVCGRNWEYPGEDPHLAGKMTEAYVKGLQSTGVAATLKVLVGNEIEFHRRGSDSRIDERALNEVYLEPFRTGIQAGAWAIMTAYNQLNGAWCGQDKYTGKTLLRDQLGFQWISMTDWIGTYDGVALTNSGTDLEMPNGWSLKKDRDRVIGGPALDGMVLNVLKTCIYAGFYEPDFKRAELESERAGWEATARKVNHEGIILLKNNGILPLSQTFAGKVILVSGNNAKRDELSGGGSGHVKGYNPKSYGQAIQEHFPNAKVVSTNSPSDEQIKVADLVLLFPGFLLDGKPYEGEGSDRPFILPDDALIARCATLNNKTVVCLTAGGGVQMDWVDQPAAIVHALYGGQTGASALLDVLTGTVNPGGKLPFTIECKLQDSPGAAVTNGVPDTNRPYASAGFPDYVKDSFFTNKEKSEFYVYKIDYQEGVFVGHRWYESKKIPVRFPFGYGLSYTTFAYEGLKVEKTGDHTVCIGFTVKNTGARDGAEIAQVYVSDKVCSVPRPLQELRGFRKIFLKSNESKRVTLPLGEEAFRFWHPVTHQWTVEPGDFEIRVGTSSADIRLKESFELTAIKECRP